MKWQLRTRLRVFCFQEYLVTMLQRCCSIHCFEWDNLRKKQDLSHTRCYKRDAYLSGSSSFLTAQCSTVSLTQRTICWQVGRAISTVLRLDFVALAQTCENKLHQKKACFITWLWLKKETGTFALASATIVILKWVYFNIFYRRMKPHTCIQRTLDAQRQSDIT